MKKNFRILICFVLFLFAFQQLSRANHLIGGNLGYQYIGPVAGNMFRYKVIFTTYTDCSPASGWTYPETTIQDIGVYNYNSATPNADKTWYADVPMTLVTATLVEPPMPSGCTVGNGTCIYQGIYEGFVDVPLSFSGYYLFYERCCRNGSILNLDTPTNTSGSFLAFIPPTLVNNSSPTFTDLPTPFLCAGDTTTLLNTAIDPDGDQLIFSFVDPYNGFATSGNPGYPAPSPPNPTLTWPIPTVIYNPGYSATQPYGVGGYIYINGATGLTKYMAPGIGNFVVAVEIKEYRNGNLIGITRRDLQILVVACPPNVTPNLSNASGGGQTSYTITEGQSLCFPITFFDVDGDSIKFTSSGQLFNSSIVNPAATIVSPVNGDSIVTTNFCWTTACGQARPLPYQFNVSVPDNGCPPKTTNVVYSIQINPDPKPASITGLPLVCQNSSATYTTPVIAGATGYNWSVTGGVIASGGTSNTVTINWGNPGSGTVSVTSTSAFACVSLPFSYNVTILSAPTALAGPDKSICTGNSVQIGGAPTGPIGATFSWSPSTGLNGTTIANPMASPVVTTTYIVTVNIGAGCIGKDTVVVFVGSNGSANAGNNEAICLGNSTQLNASGGVSFVWSPITGLSNPNIANPVANPLATTTYTVSVTDVNGCIGTANVTVSVNPNPVVDAGPNTSICLGTPVTIGGAPTGPPGSTYSWAPSGTLNNAVLANPLATPLLSTTYTVTVTNNGCSAVGSNTITVMALPPANAGNDVAICSGGNTQLTASGGATYSWLPVAGLSDPNISNPVASPSVTTTYYVTVGWANPCTKTDSVIVTVNPLPTVNAGNDVAICSGNSTQLLATGGIIYLWSPVTGLSNPNIGNPIANPVVTTVYTVTATDILGCSKMDSVLVSVNSNPFASPGANNFICTGTSVLLGGTPTGPAGSTYSWAPSATLNNSTLANPIATPLINTTYTVTVTNNSCIATGSVTITLLPLPFANAGADTSFCFGGNTQLSASGGTSYSWLPVTGLSNPNIFNPIASPVITTSYYVTVTGANGCTKNDTVNVTINQLPLANAGNDIWLCPGDNAILNASGGTVYSWSPITYLSNPTISNPVANPVDSIEYVVTVTDANGCTKKDTLEIFINKVVPTNAGNDINLCQGDTAQLGGLPTSPIGTTYLWSPSGSLDNPASPNPKAFPLTTTTYYVATANDTCTGKDSITVFVNTPPTAAAGNDATICFGGNTQLSASGGISYSWTPSTGLSDPGIFNPIASPGITTTYTVSTIDINGCSNTDAVIVNVNNLPVVDAGSNTAICLGDSTTLNASGGLSYTWSPSTALSSTGIFNPIASPTNTITYHVTVTDLNTCVNTDSVIITIDQLPIVDAGNNTQMCLGNTVQLNASGGTGYAWTPVTALSNPAIVNPVTNTLSTITYTVLVTDANGCENIDSVKITVNQLPIIDAGTASPICIGDSVQLNATGGSSYVWSPVANISNPNISNPFVDPISTFEYFVTGTDINLCVNSDSVTVVVNQLPTVDAGANTAICIGNSTTLNATGGNTYSWSPATALSNTGIFNPVASPTVAITYYVTASDVNTCVNTDSVIITVNQLPIVDAGNNTQMCIGNSIQLNASGGTGYAWTPVTALSNPAIVNPVTNTLSTITYTVLVTDANGCENSDSVKVTVNQLPIIDAGIALPICIGDSVQLIATGGTNYVWSPGANISNPNIANPFVDPVSTFEYFVTGTDINLCVNSDSVTVVVNQLPIVDAGINTAICIGNSTTLNASGGTGYLWSPATSLSSINIFNPIASPTNTITYHVTVTDVNTCVNTDSVIITVNQLPIVDAGNNTQMCIGNSVQLNASGGTGYAWTPVTALSNPAIVNPVSTALSTITYTVSVTDVNGCKNIDSVKVTVNPLPIIDAGSSSPICSGDSIQLNATGGTSYVWSPVTNISNPNVANPFVSPVTTIEYFLSGTDNNSCINKDSVTITVNPLPVITIDGGAGIGMDINICRGDTADLIASGGILYSWTPMTDINNALISSPKVYPENTTLYSVSAWDVNSCKNKDSIIVNVFRITASPDTAICEGDSVQLFAIGPNVFSYIWSPTTALSDSTVQNPWASPLSTTIYSVSATDINQCRDVADVEVSVEIVPTALFSAVYSPSCNGLSADFTNESINANSYIWNFGDGSSATDFNASHVFSYSASFLTTLIAINNGKCSDTTSIQKSIDSFNDYFTLTVPNVFTPNDDGINDEFELSLNGDVSDCFSITIFDRWGLTIFSSNRAKLQWDGRTTAGLKVTAGTYFYVLEIHGVQYKGCITLLE